ncbi:Basic 7S globulin [Melia azedarach]|uniref:Basic 7S globulin n=1 Tax=Melia azedarach TaxID=155640 RepID=A0ACC1YF10_MELAZ|nr:Basic 7S globulin [Melia azedarach]
MALSSNFLLFCSLLFIISPSIAKTSPKPNALVLPVTKDPSTQQYLTEIKQRTPLVPVKLTLDLGGKFLWVDCEKGYISSSYKNVRCGSAECDISGSGACVVTCNAKRGPGCNNNTCSLNPYNPIKRLSTGGELAKDTLAIQSTDGKNAGKFFSVRKVLFTCGATFLLEDLAQGVKGIAGLGRSNISLPSQFAATFSNFHKKFAICLSSSPRGKGVVFFGDGPYVLLPGIDVSKSLTYTPLILNPLSTADQWKCCPLNATLLSIDKEGNGGTKISTVRPYTVMETSIYKAFTKAFIKEAAKIPRVKPVKPFGTCFNSAHIGSTRVGPAVPQIDLVLPGNHVWTIFGANSMVQVRKDVVCLGFVDGGVEPTTSIVIGGHQIENNLLQFDLAKARVGFSSSLLLRQTACSNFNFTSNIV